MPQPAIQRFSFCFGNPPVAPTGSRLYRRLVIGGAHIMKIAGFHLRSCLEKIPRYGGHMSKAKKLLHTRYRVNDLERTVRFYTEVVGLEEVHRHKSPRGSA